MNIKDTGPAEATTVPGQGGDGWRGLLQGQPTGFWPLALTEFWERFSYYGLQAILTYYLLYSIDDGGIALEPGSAVAIVGVYGGGVYLTQIAGAWLADRVVAPRSLVLYGGASIAFGHVSLAVVPGLSGVICGLVLITLGTGALKTNVTAIVGTTLKERDSTDRDAGFSFYYMSINTGAVLGPLLTGLLQSHAGFHIAFGLAAVGMLAGLVQYTVKLQSLPRESAAVKNPAGRKVVLAFVATALTVAAVLIVLLATGVLSGSSLNTVVGLTSLTVVVAYFLTILKSNKVDSNEKRGICAYIPLWICETVCYALLLQIFTTVPVLVTSRVDLDISGWNFPVTWFLTLGTIAAIAGQGLLATVWKRKAVGRASVSMKFRIGLCVVGLGYLLMIATELYPAGKTISPLLVVAFVVFTFPAEAFIGPIGFSVVSKVGPEAYRTQLFALKILAMGVASTLASVFANWYLSVDEMTYFLAMSAIAFSSALVLWPLARRIDEGLRVGVPKSPFGPIGR